MVSALTEKASKSKSPAEPPKKDGEKEPDFDPILNALVLLGGNAAYFAVVLSIWLKAKQFVGNPLEIDLKKYLRSPNYEERVSFVERFHEDFRHIVDAYAGTKKVFVFIDDLDRCEIPKAADLMKAVNLLIADDPRLIFILGMDREKVAAGLAVKYEKLLPYVAGEIPADGDRAAWKRRVGLEFGQSFLQKFIQLPFRVPEPNIQHYAQFLRTISTPASTPAPAAAEVKAAAPIAVAPSGGSPEPTGVGSPSAAPAAPNAPSPEQAQARKEREMLFQGDSDKVRAVAMMIATALDPNPRRLKQFINLFRLQAYIVNELGFFDENQPIRPLSLEQLGKFVAISLKWPPMLADFADKPDLLKELQQLSVSNSPTGGSPATVRWFGEKKVGTLFQYGMKDQADVFTLDHPRLYQLLHIAPQRAKIPANTAKSRAANAT